MILRSLLAAGLLAAPMLVSAQSLRTSGAPAAFPADQAEDSTPAQTSQSRFAACTADQALNQTAGATNIFGSVAGAQELGQSFVAPCDGTLNSVAVTIQNAGNPGRRAYGTLRVYDGAGTAGTLLDSRPFVIANPAPATGQFGATSYQFLINAPVLTGQPYTFFIDMRSDSTAIQGTIGAAGSTGPYANGQAYASFDGNPAVTFPQATIDLPFQLTFNATTATQASTFNGAGWRLLSPPVALLSVQALSELNLVQGYASQYPDAGSNLLQNYTGTGTSAGFVSGSNAPTPVSAAFSFTQGRGFFWYLYNQSIPATDTLGNGGGTSESRTLANFSFSATGRAPAGTFFRTLPQFNADGVYMLGNPYARPLAVSGITLNSAATFGTLGTAFSVWDPAIANYRSLFTNNMTTNASDFVAVWQGLMGQLSGATATTAPQFRYTFTATSTTEMPPFYGRTAPTPYVQLMLDGTTATGTETHDVTAYVRFTENGLATWDADDASKLALPPGGARALLAPVGVDEFGDRARLAVNSFPATTEGTVSVPVDFEATEAGAFTISWAGAEALPEGWVAMLTDRATNTTVDLRAAPNYSFETTGATDWTERFVLDVTPGRSAVANEGTPDAVLVGTFAPNPATSAARLTFTVDAAQTVRAVVVDALGRQVAVAFDAAVAPGAEASFTVDTARLAPGTYVVRIAGDTFAETRRLTVVR